MNIVNRDSLFLFWGDRQQEITMKEIEELRFSLSLKNLIHSFGLKKFIVLDQIHTNVGMHVDETLLNSSESWFEYQADFMITNQKNYALVVLTADCVPLVLYDSKNHAIGLVHAGWKGSASGITHAAIDAMQDAYGTQIQDLECFIGPSARQCCYEITAEFIEYFKKYKYSDKLFTDKNGKIYFDNNLFVQETLKKFGIKDEKIYTTNALCTICNIQFCSFRREKDLAGRQATIVALQ